MQLGFQRRRDGDPQIRGDPWEPAFPYTYVGHNIDP